MEICPRAGILESYWNKDGIIPGILEYRRNNQQPRQPILPFGRGPRTACTFAARAAPFFEGDARTAAAGPRGLILASAYGVSARVTPFCPFLAKTGGFRWDFIAIYEQTDGLYESQYRRLFY